MNLRAILEFQDKIKTGDLTEKELDDHLEEMSKYLNDKSEKGKEIILNRMKEENFVRLVDEVRSIMLSGMMDDGVGGLLVLSNMSGELEAYTHTIILSVLAILAEEEVI